MEYPDSNIYFENIVVGGWFRRNRDDTIGFKANLTAYSSAPVVTLNRPIESLNEDELKVMLKACRMARRMRAAAKKVDDD